MGCVGRLRALARVVAGCVFVVALPVSAASQSGAPSSTVDSSRAADARTPESGTIQPAPPRDLRTRRDGAVFPGGYGWPYREFSTDYTNFRPRYRDYARDYGNFAYTYSGSAPRYRDFVSDYGEFAYDYQPEPSYSRPEPAMGLVIIDVLPTSAQLFIDGQYFGMSYELGAGFTLEAGSHRLEVRADDYDPVAMDIMIDPGRVMRYEGTLVRRSAQPEPDALAVPPVPPIAPAGMTIYFIPRCYLGNVPPTAVKMPAGCDIKDLKVIPPVKQDHKK
jgi:hypothetical protein